MPIIGFEFTKINIEKLSKPTGKISISNNLKIKDLETEQITVSKQEDVLKFTFNYTVNYEPKVGSIVLEGFILFHEESKKVKELITNWKKNKKIPQEVAQVILNAALFKCNIKSLELSQEVNLPPHIPLPRLNPAKNPKDYIG